MRALEHLRLLNQKIERFNSGLHDDSSPSSSSLLNSIFEDMCHIAPMFMGPDVLEDPQAKIEFDAYRNNLCALRSALPVVEGLLLAEKARLLIKRSHLDVAAQWLAASKETW